MAETRRGGFHALEKKIHDIESQDRATEKKAEAEKKGKVQAPPEAEKAAERRPPPEHDE
ncbi:hypothetical protein [Anaeromyxobacter oryzisoli]|jgi:hypothetical protein|uniref:hypothetical protein n=1 Tax=Anaeromyxobacter oryzisoli TaxID=2925408 RepID=UPI001F5A51A9|nr:hypothetical protein [Anaeromyxobacter sp. SG63]